MRTGEAMKADILLGNTKRRRQARINGWSIIIDALNLFVVDSIYTTHEFHFSVAALRHCSLNYTSPTHASASSKLKNGFFALPSCVDFVDARTCVHKR